MTYQVQKSSHKNSKFPECLKGSSFSFNDFFKAAERSDLKKINEYLNMGVSVNTYDLTGRTILHIASANGNIPVIERVLSLPESDIDIATLNYCLTSLHEAVLAEQMATTSYLLMHNANPNLVSSNGESAVHMATKKRHIGILRQLITFNSSLNIVSVFMQTPLSLAILDARNLSLATFLLVKGANVNKQRPSAMYILHETIVNCTREEDIRFVMLLVKYGAIVNYVDELGRNSLHYAAISGFAIIIQYLLRLGVPHTIRDKSSRTPLDVARDYGNVNAVKILSRFTI